MTTFQVLWKFILLQSVDGFGDVAEDLVRGELRVHLEKRDKHRFSSTCSWHVIEKSSDELFYVFVPRMCPSRGGPGVATWPPKNGFATPSAIPYLHLEVDRVLTCRSKSRWETGCIFDNKMVLLLSKCYFGCQKVTFALQVTFAVKKLLLLSKDYFCSPSYFLLSKSYFCPPSYFCC